MAKRPTRKPTTKRQPGRKREPARPFAESIEEVEDERTPTEQPAMPGAERRAEAE